LRKAARAEGGAIGFIEEFDAIGGARSGMNSGSMREGIVGVVNELLVQMQSFDESTMGGRMRGWGIDRLNRFMPAAHQIRKRQPTGANILVIGATNRAADLDPALLRPGRFDRAVYFGLPGRGGRRDIIDYYLKSAASGPVTLEIVGSDGSDFYLLRSNVDFSTEGSKRNSKTRKYTLACYSEKMALQWEKILAAPVPDGRILEIRMVGGRLLVSAYAATKTRTVMLYLQYPLCAFLHVRLAK
jgi:SpoVK/Ycf46/Vps4 family AAA+-type ATPase